jgi:iron-sulfur cluster repair protein YtfE (RIC family)
MQATTAFEAIRAFGEHEHRDIASGLALIHEAGGLSEPGADALARRSLREVLAWAARTLEPHMAWEETWLYPQIEFLTGTPWSTRAARVDHAQIAAVLAILRLDEARGAHTVTPVATADLRRHLVTLEALLRSHVDREEQLLLPVLDAGEAQP